MEFLLSDLFSDGIVEPPVLERTILQNKDAQGDHGSQKNSIFSFSLSDSIVTQNVPRLTHQRTNLRLWYKCTCDSGFYGFANVVLTISAPS